MSNMYSLAAIQRPYFGVSLMAKLLAKLEALTDACISAGVKMLGAQEGAALAEQEFFKKVDASGLDLVNIETEEGDVQLGRIADGRLDKAYSGALEFVNDEAVAGKAKFSPDKTKAQLQAVRRGYKRTLKKQIIKHLSGKAKPAEPVKKSVFERTVNKIRPEMNTIRDIAAPTQAQMDLLTLLRKVDDHCKACDPAAKVVSLALTAKETKGNVKKTKKKSASLLDK